MKDKTYMFIRLTIPIMFLIFYIISREGYHLGLALGYLLCWAFSWNLIKTSHKTNLTNHSQQTKPQGSRSSVDEHYSRDKTADTLRGCGIRFKIAKVKGKEIYANCGEYESESNTTGYCLKCLLDKENHSQQTKQTDDGQTVTEKVHDSCLDKTADTLRGCGKVIVGSMNPDIYCGDYIKEEDYLWLCKECSQTAQDVNIKLPKDSNTCIAFEGEDFEQYLDDSGIVSCPGTVCPETKLHIKDTQSTEDKN